MFEDNFVFKGGLPRTHNLYNYNLKQDPQRGISKYYKGLAKIKILKINVGLCHDSYGSEANLHSFFFFLPECASGHVLTKRAALIENLVVISLVATFFVKDKNLQTICMPEVSSTSSELRRSNLKIHCLLKPFTGFHVQTFSTSSCFVVFLQIQSDAFFPVCFKSEICEGLTRGCGESPS